MFATLGVTPALPLVTGLGPALTSALVPAAQAGLLAATLALVVAMGLGARDAVRDTRLNRQGRAVPSRPQRPLPRRLAYRLTTALLAGALVSATGSAAHAGPVTARPVIASAAQAAGDQQLVADASWAAPAEAVPVTPPDLGWTPTPPPAHSDTGMRTPAPRPDPEDLRTVVVRRGDCLWTIAARALGPAATDAQIAMAWPHWYAANRATIGPDPDLLLPGQRLLAPRS